MDLFHGLIEGFYLILSPTNLLFCFLGVFIGTLVGVLPGIGSATAVAMLLPLTFYLPPSGSLVMLAAIYYGSQYGGSTTAILVNVPGEVSSVVSCLDGHAMALQGRASSALAIAALASFLAGCIGTLTVGLLSGPLSAVALNFRSPDYFSFMLLGLTASIVLAQGSILKAMAMALFGLLLGTVGTDITSGDPRYSFGIFQLANGVSFIAVAVGLFGFAEVATNLARARSEGDPEPVKVTGFLPTREDIRRAWKPALRGSLVGCALGPLPGSGTTLSAFAAYLLEKRIAADPSRFGHGAVEGLAAPEAANNSAAQTSFIPLLTLGIPGNAVMAMMLGALILQGINPGPQVITRYPELFWGLVASMFVGNLMLLVLNLPLVGLWAKLLFIPYRLLYPAILILGCIGVYSVNNSAFDLLTAAAFGVVGYVFSRIGCHPVPLLLALIIGPMMEENFRRSLTLSKGDMTIFVTEPISLGLIIATVVLLASVALPALRRRRKEAFAGSEA